MIGDNSYKINKTESWVFVVITLLNLFPILFTKFVPTIDGACHLYNSKLINHLLFDAPSRINDFFTFNHEPVPNYFGHILLSFFNLCFPAWLSEKAMIIFYLLVFPFSFRRLIISISPNNLLLSYLVFPFTYNIIFFYLGFYNNSFAIIFMLLALSYWIRNEEDLNFFSNKLNPKKGRWRKRFLFILLLLLTYFSHLFIFGILLFIIGIQILIKNFADVKSFMVLFRKSITLILFSIIPLVLIFFYFQSRKSTGEIDYLSFNEHLFWLKNLILTYDEDPIFVGILFYSFVILVIAAIIYRIRNVRKFLVVSDFYLVAAILLLVFYFTIPDGDGVAGYVTLRLGLLFFIILSIWIASQHIPMWVIVAFISVMLVCHFKLNVDRMNTIEPLNTIAIDVYNLSKQIEPNSLVLPINCSDNSRLIHFSSYLGIDKPIIVLDNYECERGWFPLYGILKRCLPR